MRTGTRQEPIGKSKTKIFGFALCTLLLPLCVPAEAQQPKKVPRIGYLVSVSLSSTREVGQVEAFRQGLRELGYVEGQNIAIEWRFAKVTQIVFLTLRRN